MTGPTTAAELLSLASQELAELTSLTGTEQAANPAELATAWPAFHRAGQHLLATIVTDPGSDPAQAKFRREPAATVISTGNIAPEPHLNRAADLLSAAADLLAGRDRRALSEADRRADAALAAGPLLTGAYLVADATLRDPVHVKAAASAVTAVRDWSAAAPTQPQPDVARRVDASSGVGTLDDASTQPSPSRMQLPVSLSTGTAADLPELVSDAVQDWQRAALAAGQLPTPSSLDLRGSARAAGSLLAMSQLLLRAYPDGTAPDASAEAGGHAMALEATVARIQEAGRGWNAAADWGVLTTGTPADPALLMATSQLDQAISLLARTEGRWAVPHEIARRADGAAALAAARGALAAVQIVAEQHALVVRRLVQTGGVYAPAVQLTPTIERVSDRLAHRWVPITKTEGRTLTDAYTQLPDRTAGARLAYAHLTSPSCTGCQGREPSRTELAVEHRLVRREAAVSTVSVQPEPPATTVAGQRWQRTCQELDPRLLSDPHWLALAGALDRVELAGADVTATLALALADQALPVQHPARELHYRLVQVSTAAATPYTSAPAPSLPPSRLSPPGAAPVSPAVGRVPGPRR